MVRELLTYIHTESESRQALSELQKVQKDTAQLLDDYIEEESKLRGSDNYMEKRSPLLAKYRRMDKEIWDIFVKRHRELHWDIGTEK